MRSAASSLEPVGMRALMVGALRVNKFHRGEAKFSISLSPRVPCSSSQFRPRERQIIESLLGGCSQKQVAHDLKLTANTISDTIQRILRKVGVARWEHLVVVGCALDAAKRRRSRVLQQESAQELELEILVHPSWASGLSPAERDVSLHIIDGCSYAQISRARSTSVRTIANQISSVFRKLNVRGRLELILRLLADDGA